MVSTARKAAWNSNRPLRFPKANLKIYSNGIREQLLAHDIVPVIPPKSNRITAIDYEHDLYKLREKVERFFNKLKQFRRIATRYEKLSQTFLALIHLGAAWIIIK